jgi:hypothetical protein
VLTVALIAIILLALLFDYSNGFHDAANAIASAISTRALTPRTALIIAAVANLGGALISTGVAVTVAKSIIDPPAGTAGMAVVLAALVGAIAWNFITWYFGLPSSSSQALIGGLVGAGLASGSTVHWTTGVVDKVIIPMILSPAVGLIGGYLLMVIALWVLRRANPHRVDRGFRIAQIFSATSLALGPRSAGCPEEHGHHRAGTGHCRLPAGLHGADLGHRAMRHGAGGWHLLGRLADHAHARSSNLPVAAGTRLRRRGDRFNRAVSHRIRDCGAHLDDPGDDGIGDGSREHPSALRGPLGSCPRDWHGLGTHTACGRHHRGARVPTVHAAGAPLSPRISLRGDSESAISSNSARSQLD